MRATLTISLPIMLRKKLDRVVKKEHVNRSDVVREALRRYFVQEEFENIRRWAVPHARKLGYFTDEDIFKEIS